MFVVVGVGNLYTDRSIVRSRAARRSIVVVCGVRVRLPLGATMRSREARATPRLVRCVALVCLASVCAACPPMRSFPHPPFLRNWLRLGRGMAQVNIDRVKQKQFVVWLKAYDLTRPWVEARRNQEQEQRKQQEQQTQQEQQ